MIKFFRKIRHSLIAEGKFTKYLKYAIGEIVLVVIGILIALTINNWNQDRQNYNREKAYLKNIEADLLQQLSYIDIQLENENNSAIMAEELLERHKRDDGLKIDSISSKQLNELTIRKTFTKADPTYRDLISTGNIGLIKDKTLRNQLALYYMELDRIERILFNNNLLYVDELFAMKLVEICYIGETDERLIATSNQLLNDPQNEMLFINLLDLRRDLAQGHIDFMNELKDKTQEMLASLKKQRP